MQAIFNDVVIAESSNTVVVEGNHSFPPQSINKEYFKKTSKMTLCPWKGEATHFTITANGKSYKNGAWCYETPLSEATKIQEHVAFYGGVKVVKKAKAADTAPTHTTKTEKTGKWRPLNWLRAGREQKV